jgi:hypothetical protein
LANNAPANINNRAMMIETWNLFWRVLVRLLTIKEKVLAAGISLLTSLCALVVSYEFFDWVLIRYWEWQHDGRRMKITFWADFRALQLAVLFCIVVLIPANRLIRKRMEKDRLPDVPVDAAQS